MGNKNLNRHLKSVNYKSFFTCVGPVPDFKLFGDILKDLSLAPTAAHLFENATVNASRNTNKCGEKQFRRFALQYMGAYFIPKTIHQLSLRGLVLCFFTASLFLNRKNLKSSTIRNYVGHIRPDWEKSGATLTHFDKKIISRILKGVAALRPTTADKRTAFLLPHFEFPETVKNPLSKDQLIFKAAVIFGFLGMFRYSSFGKLSCHSVVLISQNREEFTLETGTYLELEHLIKTKNIFGFYFRFAAKFHHDGRAYYCKLSDLNDPWNKLCPLKILIELSRNGLLSAKKIFDEKLLTSKSLGAYMQYIAKTRSKFTPHSLRIGGHTFYSIQNMHGDFVQFLGRRSINRASQLYYRASAADNISRLRLFFTDISFLPLFGTGLYGVPN